MPRTLDCKQSLSIPPSLKDKPERVRVDMSRLPCIARSPFSIVLHWYRNSALRLLLSEGNSALQRIRWIREIRAVEHSSGKDSVRQWRDQSLVPAVYKSAYISHMQQMETRHPFLSMFDLSLLSQTWKAGLEYGIHIGTLQSRDKSCDQFSQVPDAGTDASGHCGGHAQG